MNDKLFKLFDTDLDFLEVIVVMGPQNGQSRVEEKTLKRGLGFDAGPHQAPWLLIDIKTSFNISSKGRRAKHARLQRFKNRKSRVEQTGIFFTQPAHPVGQSKL